MTTATNNGSTQRRQLSDQLDRLDTILDGLSDALNESIADAVRGVISHAVGEAVHAAVKEVLASPDLLRAALERHGPTPASEPKPPTLKQNVARIANGLREKLEQTAGLVTEKLSAAARIARTALSVAPTLLRAVAEKVWAFRRPCAVAVGVGVAFGAACFLGGQIVSSVANGMSATALTLSAMSLPLKRLLRGGER